MQIYSLSLITDLTCEYSYLQVKQKENEAALLNLSQRLDALDKLTGDQKQIELIEGILAGNVFDWGAREVVK